MSAIRHDRQDSTPELAPERLEAFRAHVLREGRELYRDLPWRRTRDPYAIWVSEVMLQQTQVSRVDGRWQRWLERFPTVEALAAAEPADVLEEWQGLGYNRRALALQRAAQAIAERGSFPQETAELVRLPGIGPATAAGIRAFAWDLPAVYLETNVRTVFLHELFPGEDRVPDSRIVPLVEATCPQGSPTPTTPRLQVEDALSSSSVTMTSALSLGEGADDVPVAPATPAPAADPADTPRTWYYALLDYGAHLKATLPNPSRRSRSHTRQTRFEGSHRQKRAELVRLLISHRTEGGAPVRQLAAELSSIEEKAGRLSLSVDEVAAILAELSGEGFCREEGGLWNV